MMKRGVSFFFLKNKSRFIPEPGEKGGGAQGYMEGYRSSPFSAL